MKNEFHNIIIIGGGPIGMTLSLLLAKKGLSSCIVEKNSGISRVQDHRTTAISLGSTKILEEINIWNYLKKKSQPIKKILVNEDNFSQNIDFDSQLLNKNALGFIVANRFLKNILENLVAKNKLITLKNNQEIVKAEIPEQKSEEKIKIFTKNYSLQTNLLIGADGRRSKTRFLAEIKYYYHDYHQNAYVFTINHEKPHNSVALERFFPTGPLALLPMKSKSNVSSVVWSIDQDHGDFSIIPKDEFKYEFKIRYQDFHGKINHISKPQKYPLNIYSCYKYFNNRVVLVGDACQALHPIAGQGFNLGLRDVNYLSNILFEAQNLGLDIGSDTVLENYAKKRFLDKNLLIQATHKLNTVFSVKIKLFKFLRKFGLTVFNKSKFLKSYSMLYAMGLKDFEI